MASLQCKYLTEAFGAGQPCKQAEARIQVTLKNINSFTGEQTTAVNRGFENLVWPKRVNWSRKAICFRRCLKFQILKDYLEVVKLVVLIDIGAHVQFRSACAALRLGGFFSVALPPPETPRNAISVSRSLPRSPVQADARIILASLFLRSVACDGVIAPLLERTCCQAAS